MTVTDDDTAGVVVSETSVTVDEDGGTATYTVVLTSQPSSNVTVTPTSSATGNATVSGALTFTPTNWETAQTVTVTGVNDDVDGADRAATISHTVAGGGYGSVQAADVAVTITDDDTAGVVVSETSVTVDEDGGTATYTVVLTSQPSGDVTVTPTSSATGNATVSGALTFTRDNWETAQTVTVTGVNDDVDGADRAATISHTVAGGGYGSVKAADVAVTITDDDTAGVVVSETSVTVDEDGGTATYTVVLTSQPSSNVTVTPTSSATGNATVSGALTFTPTNWETAQTVTVTGVNDDVDGADRAATISHTVAGGGYGSVQAADVAVTITDDDTAGVAVSETSVTVDEDGGTATYTVVLTSQPSGDVTVTPTSSATGNATVSGALTFTPTNWETAQTVTVTGVNDDVDGADRAATISHTVAGGGYGSVQAADVAVTITDDDTAGVVVSETSVTVDEDGGTATYTVVLTSQPSSNVTVTPTSSATGNATVSGALTFTPTNWETAQTVTVTGVNDDVDGADRAATISHTVAGGGYGSVKAADVAVTITDDDTAGVVVSETSVTVDEDGGTATYTVVLTSQPSSNVTVTPTSSATGNATVSGALTFTPTNWETAQTVTVTGVDDDVDNAGDQRRATVTHHVSGSGYETVEADDVAVTVVDDDDAMPRVVELAVSPTRISEGSGPTQVTVTATLPNAATFAAATELTVTVGGGDSTATAGVDFEDLVPLPLTFQARARSASFVFVLKPLDDRLDEKEETIRISARRSDDGPPLSVTSRVISLVDDDDAAAQIIAPALTRFGRTVGEQVVDAITARMKPDLALGFAGRIAGQDIQSCDPAPRERTREIEPLDGADTPGRDSGERPCTEADTRARDALQARLQGPQGAFGLPGAAGLPGSLQDAGDLLAGTSFSYLSQTDSGARIGFWGKGVLSRYEGTQGKVDLTGDVAGVMVGADWRNDSSLIGLMVSRSHGDIGYRYNTDPAGSGRVKAELTAFVPYAMYEFTERLQGWVAPGYGLGHMVLKPEDGPDQRAPIDWYMVAAGLKAALVVPSADRGLGLDLTADFLHTRTASDALAATETLPAVSATSGMTQRFRLGFEARWEQALPYGGFTPYLDVALRHDGGDAETGWGVETGGGFVVSDPVLGLDLEVSGRTLALHEDGRFGNWGLGVALTWDPSPDTKRGWSARLGHDFGDTSTGGRQALFEPSVFPTLQDTQAGQHTWSFEAAYGLPPWQGLVGSPHAVLSGSDAVERARLGYRIEPDQSDAPDLDLEVWGQSDFEDHENSAGLRFQIRW